MPGLDRAENDRPPGTERHALKEQRALWDELMRLAHDVEASLVKSVGALCSGQTELAVEVVAEERDLDDREVEIEQACVRVLTLYEPVASDLRKVGAILKINKNLERMADLAVHIAKRARKMARDPDAVPASEALCTLAAAAVASVHEVLAALSDTNTAAAHSIFARDREIDRLYRIAINELKQSIRRDPERVNVWLRLINSARNLERIGDHATNIAEAVLYVSEGVIVRRIKPTADD